MCFHNSMSKKAQQLAARYGRKADIIEIVRDMIEEQYHVSAFNFPEYPVITGSDEIQVYNWGLIPFWVRNEQDAAEIRKMTLNAREDTIFEKPSFREPVMKKRCIIPSTGYFEWRHAEGKKIPYYIYLKDEPIFSMAGIYDTWLDKQTGEEVKTFSIITTGTNELTDYIHNTGHRMPVILPAGEEEEWLNPDLSGTDIKHFLKPFEAGKMDAYIIESDFIKKSPHDETILRRA